MIRDWLVNSFETSSGRKSNRSANAARKIGLDTSIPLEPG
jgi:hypothetical protein